MLKALFNFILGFTQIGYVEPMSVEQFRDMWHHPNKQDPVSWWYQGSDAQYHYITERWDVHRLAWKIDKSRLQLIDVKQYHPGGGADYMLELELKAENLGFCKAV